MTHPPSDLRSRLKHMGFSIYVDLRRFGEALRERLPWAAARRRAEYVLIDGKQVPIGVGAADFERKHLRDVKVQDGLGFTRHAHHDQGTRHAHAPSSPGPGPRIPAAARGSSSRNLPSFVRHDRQPPSPHL